VLEAEAIGQVLVVHKLGPSRRIVHAHGHVAEHPQPGETGVERLPDHPGQQAQPLPRIDRLVNPGQSADRSESKLTPIEVFVQPVDTSQLLLKIG
jgi:hypothetical protein